MGDPIPRLADRCESRGFLAGFFEGWIEHNDRVVDMGQTDKALIEKTLDLLESEQDLLVINPFSYSLVPALIAASYTFVADTRTVSGDVRSTGNPLLLFPKQGYIGDIESFSYSDIVSGESIIDKDNISDLADFKGGNRVYRVTDESVLGSSEKDMEIGLMFVDLRKDLWQNNVAEFESFTRRNQITTVVYYSDERNFATANVAETVDEELEVSRSTIAETETESLGENPSRARTEEYIVNQGVDISITSVDPGDLEEMFDDLYEARQGLQKAAPDLYAVPEINNLLVELAVEPSVYDEQVRENFYYSSTSRLIEGLQEARNKTEETVTGRLDEYWRLADDLRAELEKQNPKKRVLKARVEDATETAETTVFVARNQMHRDAIERGLFLDDVDIGDTVKLVTKAEVDPRPDTKHVFVNLLGFNHPLYEFPPSTDVEFLVYPFLKNVVENELTSDGADTDGDDSGATSEVVHVEDSEEIGRPDTVEFSRSEIEVDVAQSLATTETTDGDSHSERRGSEGSAIENIEIQFSDGSTQETTPRSMMTILDPDADTVRRRRARDLRPGDKVVILGEAATDLYEIITEQQHQKESIQQREMLIERWREILNESLNSDYTTDEILNKLQERGSDLQTTATIESWAEGDTLGPRSHEDVHLVLEIARPGSEGASKDIHEAMRYIRTLHRRIGRRVHRIVEAEIDTKKEARFESGIGSQLNNIGDKIDIKHVSDTKTV